MPVIRFKKKIPDIEANNNSNLMASLTQNAIPVGSSCGGEGVCTKCLIKIIDGAENLSPKNEREISLDQQHNISSNQRVSCQTTIHGDICIDTDYW